jgi:hypothetical protein
LPGRDNEVLALLVRRYTAVQACNLSIQEMEVGGFGVQDKPGLHSETLSQKSKRWEYGSVVDCKPSMHKVLG